MRRAQAQLVLTGLAFVAGCSDTEGVESTVSSAPSIARSPGAAVVADVRARTHGALPIGVVRELAPESGSVRPILSAQGGAVGADVLLPERAQDPVRLRDPASGVTVTVALEAATNSRPELAEGLTIYRDALGPGARVVHVTSTNGTEDFLALERASDVAYRVDLVQGVAGLRLVANTLEFVDAGGAPRLRMSAPWLVDEGGITRPVATLVDGCDVDTNPASPWGRSVVPAGAATCTVRLALPRGVSGRVVIDPAWQTTGSMNVLRYAHGADILQTGIVLVAGGSGQSGPIKSAELYDPTSGTWATTGSLQLARSQHTVTTLASGRVLAAGGLSGGQSTNTSEVYDPSTGAWGTSGAITMSPRDHTASRLPSGKVLVVGGLGNSSGAPLVTSSIFDPSTGSWTAGPKMLVRRAYHAATTLMDGRILVTGGNGSNITGPPTGMDPLKNVEIFDESSPGWMETDSLAIGRARHQAARLPNGDVLVIGGETDMSLLTASTEVYSPATGNWKPSSNISTVRELFVAVPLPSGHVLAIGGQSMTGNGLAATECYDYTEKTWSDMSDLTDARSTFAGTLLQDGRLLVEGGIVAPVAPPLILSSAELFVPLAGGVACNVGCDCASGLCVQGACCAGTKANGDACGNPCECLSARCVDGLCCNQPCDAACEACSAAKKGGGVDGVCGPVAKGKSDPRHLCKDEGAESCGTNSACDGHGVCSAYESGTACSPPSCENAAVVAAACNAKGQCVSSSEQCSPYGCTGAPPTCGTTCKNIDDCAKGFVCTSDGQCIPSPQNKPPDEFGGCCGVAGRSPDEPWPLALIVAGTALAFARRRKRS